ncbi:hypothetical protein SODALDRAFT_334439 [Sodiomyces alkalinus F11]|uniref:C2H2-type domain-containing protein n=1 Tax=Sodiomyces alkalinus (strain CBS 110278 / VKM F-3762 / F11) TaxID=1314773 RepID=A0A3N2PS52_SODAK|nr:hypothetical protein SODALDRAFT_334439 [Sodiomyces alkalinus F11]ROT37349.1 hypothetical protein SODALDRAFT_334439 [Sodiomyces alkalinus F11]
MSSTQRALSSAAPPSHDHNGFPNSDFEPDFFNVDCSPLSPGDNMQEYDHFSHDDMAHQGYSGPPSAFQLHQGSSSFPSSNHQMNSSQSGHVSMRNSNCMAFYYDDPNANPQAFTSQCDADRESWDCKVNCPECRGCDSSTPGPVCSDTDCPSSPCDENQCDPYTRCSGVDCVPEDEDEDEDELPPPELQEAAVALNTLHNDPGYQAPLQPQLQNAVQHNTQSSTLRPGQFASRETPGHGSGAPLSAQHATGGQAFSNSTSHTAAPVGTGMVTTSLPGDFQQVEAFQHLWQQHDPNQPHSQCAEPCLFNSYSASLRCPMPQFAHAQSNAESFCQPAISNPGYNVPCGDVFPSAWEWVNHFNEQHRNAHNADCLQAFFPQSFPQNYVNFGNSGLGNGYQHSTHMPRLEQAEQPVRRSSSTSTGSATNTSEDVNQRSSNTPATDDSVHTLEGQAICKWVRGEDGGVCGKAFATDDALHAHCRQAHIVPLDKDGDGFSCLWEKCNRKHKPHGKGKFGQKSKLERHLQTHTGYKPVECPYCGVKLSAKQSLEQHIRIHTGETPWPCSICNAQFKQQSALTMHMRTHNGEKPLQCEICNKAFSESSNLSKHRKTHKVRGDHVCPLCDKDFHRPDQMRRHLRSHDDKMSDQERAMLPLQVSSMLLWAKRGL